MEILGQTLEPGALDGITPKSFFYEDNALESSWFPAMVADKESKLWFGTTKWWDYRWLSEGFAGIMSFEIMELVRKYTYECEPSDRIVGRIFNPHLYKTWGPTYLKTKENLTTTFLF